LPPATSEKRRGVELNELLCPQFAPICVLLIAHLEPWQTYRSDFVRFDDPRASSDGTLAKGSGSFENLHVKLASHPLPVGCTAEESSPTPAIWEKTLDIITLYTETQELRCIKPLQRAGDRFGFTVDQGKEVSR
jgi:hypothetical protein